MRTQKKEITVYLDGRNDSARVGDMAVEIGKGIIFRSRQQREYCLFQYTVNGWRPIANYSLKAGKRLLREYWGIEL